MIVETKEVYRCGFCNKFYQRKHACLKHEVRCNKNPENERKCFTCEHLCMKESRVDIGIDGYYTGEPIIEPKDAFFCNKLKVHLKLPISVHKGLSYDFVKYENIPMKKECELYNKETEVVFKH